MSKELKVITEEKIPKIDLDYSELDKETEDFIKQATINIFLLKEKTKNLLGKVFSEAQEKLAGKNQHDGFFEKWYTAIGFKRDFVYACMRYYKLLVANADNQLIEALSFSKGSEVGKLNDNTELQKEIIDKAPLNEMKAKEVAKLVKEVRAGKEVTEELIDEIRSKTGVNNTNLKKFLKVTNSFINDLKEQSEEMSKNNIEKVLKLVDEVKELCSVEKVETEKSDLEETA